MMSGSHRAALIGGMCLAGLMLSGCHPYGKPALGEVDPEKSTDFPTLFAQNCRGCHGDNGKYGPGRILNDPLYTAFIPREEIKKVLTYGRPGTAMPAWAQSQGGPLSEKQIDVLVSGIKDGWAKPVDLHGTTLPSYSADIKAGDATRGKKLFVRSCFACHGSGAAVGVITNATYLQLSSDQNLRTSIVVGRPDVPVKKLLMPNYMYLNAGHALSDQDISDLVTYVASFRPAQQIMEGAHTKENINTGENAAGNQGSGNGPGSPDTGQNKGQKHTNSSIQGGTVQGHGPQH
jgi:cytochrome c oxidase cbb3-type subunit III